MATNADALAFNDSVTLQEFSEASRDSIGGIIRSWVDVRSFWARIEDISVREYIAADAPRGRRLVKVRCYVEDTEGIDPSKRLTAGSRILQVDGVLRDRAGDRATVVCSEVFGESTE